MQVLAWRSFARHGNVRYSLCAIFAAAPAGFDGQGTRCFVERVCAGTNAQSHMNTRTDVNTHTQEPLFAKLADYVCLLFICALLLSSFALF